MKKKLADFDRLHEIQLVVAAGLSSPEQAAQWLKDIGIDSEDFMEFCRSAGKAGVIALGLYDDPEQVLTSVYAAGFEMGVNYAQQELGVSTPPISI